MSYSRSMNGPSNAKKEAAAATIGKGQVNSPAAQVTDNNNNRHDNDKGYAARNYDGSREPYKPINDRYVADENKPKGNNEKETYGKPVSTQKTADRKTEDPPPRKYGGGYQPNHCAVDVYNDDNKNDTEDEQIRKDVANRYTLSPGGRHVVEKKDGEPSNGTPQIVIIKKLVFRVEHSKIENLGMKNGRAKEQHNPSK